MWLNDIQCVARFKSKPVITYDCPPVCTSNLSHHGQVYDELRKPESSSLEDVRVDRRVNKTLDCSNGGYFQHQTDNLSFNHDRSQAFTDVYLPALVAF